MSSAAKSTLGRLPGEPKKRMKPTGTLPITKGSSVTKVQLKDLRALMGKAVYPVYLDFSPDYYNLEDALFMTNCQNVVKALDLSGNSLIEVESLSHLAKLKVLYAERNVISNFSFRGLVGLELLSLRFNRLETLSDMTDLKKLVNLDLQNNRLRNGFEELAKIKTLRVLDLSHNPIDFQLPEFHNFVMAHLKKIPKLEYLAIEDVPAEHHIPEFRLYIVNELPKLRFFNWVAVTKEEQKKAAELESKRVWQAKNGPVSKIPVSKMPSFVSLSTAPSMPSSSPVTLMPNLSGSNLDPRQSRRLSSTLDNLLSEIDQLGLLDAGEEPLPPSVSAPPPQSAAVVPSPVPPPQLPTTSAPALPASLAPEPPKAPQEDDYYNTTATDYGDEYAAYSTPASTAPNATPADEEPAERKTAFQIGRQRPNQMTVVSPPETTLAPAPLPPPVSPPKVPSPQPQKSPSPAVPAGGSMQIDEYLEMLTDVEITESSQPAAVGVASQAVEDLSVVSADDHDGNVLMDLLNEMLGDQPKTPTAQVTSEPLTTSPATLVPPVAERPASPVAPPPAPTVVAPIAAVETAPIPNPDDSLTSLAMSLREALESPSPSPEPIPERPVVALKPEPAPVSKPEPVAAPVVPVVPVAKPEPVAAPVAKPEPVAVAPPPAPVSSVAPVYTQAKEELDVLAASARIAAPATLPTLGSETRSAVADISALEQALALGVAEEPSAPSWHAFADQVKMQERLGCGMLGETYKGLPIKEGGPLVVIKKIHPQRFSESFLSAISAEVTRLHALEHKSIAKIVAACTENIVCYMNEYYAGPDIRQFARTIKSGEALGLRLRIAREIAEGMQYLHANGVVHGALKSSDIILTDSMSIKIRDYGFTSLKTSRLAEGVQYSLEYQPMETFVSRTSFNLSQSTDAFSFGVILWELYEGGWGDDKRLLPAPHQGRPFSPSFSTTPVRIQSLILRCTQSSTRPTFTEIVTALSASDSELCEVAQQVIPDAEREKIRSVCRKLVELLETPSDAAPLTALRGIKQSIIKMETTVRAAVEDGVLEAVIGCFSSSYETVVESAVGTALAMADFPVVLQEFRKIPKSFQKLFALLSSQNEATVMISLRLLAQLLSNSENREIFILAGGIQLLIIAIQTATNDMITTSAVLASSRLLKSESSREEFYNKGGLSLCIGLVDKNNPVLLLHVLSVLSWMLLYQPAHGPIIDCQALQRLQGMLASKSELVVTNTLKCIIRFTSDSEAIKLIKPEEWIEPICPLVNLSEKVRLYAFRALANLALSDESCYSVESSGCMPLVIAGLSNPLENQKVYKASLSLLERLLTTSVCRDAFSSYEGFSPLSLLYQRSSRSPEIQRKCLTVLEILSSHDSMVETIAETGILPPLVKQMVSSSKRGDEETLSQTLSVLRHLASARELALQAFKFEGGLDVLVDMTVRRSPETDEPAQLAILCLASLMSSEEGLCAVEATGCLSHLFSFLSVSNTAFKDKLLRALVQNLKVPGFQESLVKFDSLPHVAQLLTSNSTIIQSLSLKISLLLLQNPDFKSAILGSGIPEQLRVAATSAENPTIRSACERALALVVQFNNIIPYVLR